MNVLIRSVREGFEKIPEHRPTSIKISLTDVLMSAFAMFSFKGPSLLAFDRRRKCPTLSHNLQAIYHIENIPSDTAMREILDGYYLLSLDGTGYFPSSDIHCDSCLEKHHRNGKITYLHQMLGASIVHPDITEPGSPPASGGWVA